jgi:hypothetical protein
MMNFDPAVGSSLTPMNHLTAAAVAGAVTVVMTNPIWVLKTRMCIQDNQSSTAYRNVIGTESLNRGECNDFM